MLTQPLHDGFLVVILTCAVIFTVTLAGTFSPCTEYPLETHETVEDSEQPFPQGDGMEWTESEYVCGRCYW